MQNIKWISGLFFWAIVRSGYFCFFFCFDFLRFNLNNTSKWMRCVWNTRKIKDNWWRHGLMNVCVFVLVVVSAECKLDFQLPLSNNNSSNNKLKKNIPQKPVQASFITAMSENGKRKKKKEKMELVLGKIRFLFWWIKCKINRKNICSYRCSNCTLQFEDLFLLV